MNRTLAPRRSRTHGGIALALLLGVTSACGPAVRNAGHTITSESPRKTGSDGPQQTPTSPAADKSGDSAPTADSPAPLTRPPETRKDLYAEIPEGGKVIGKPGPIALEGFSRTGHWVAHCALPDEARVDDRAAPQVAPQLRLTIGSRTDTIAALLGADTSGRYLVVLVDRAAWLIDAVEKRRVDLSPLHPDLRFDGRADHRSFAFAADGLALLTLDEKNPGTTGAFVAFSDERLYSGKLTEAARRIDWGKRPVFRIEGSDQAVHAMTLAEGASAKSWPMTERPEPTQRCLAPVAPYDAFARVTSYRPDRALGVSWVHLKSSKQSDSFRATEAPGFIASYKDGWLRREDSGRLLLVRGGTQKQIASERCGARILRADFESDLFFAACEQYTPVAPRKSKRKSKPKFRFDLYLLRPGFVRKLNADVMRTGIDFLGAPGRSLYPVRPGAVAALVDFKARRMVTLEGEVHVLATTATQALLRRDNRLTLWKAGKETPVLEGIPSLAPQLTQGPTVGIDKTVFLLGDELLSRDLPAAPLAITEQGYSLIPKKAPTLDRWPEGPLLLMGPPQSAPTNEQHSNGEKKGD